MDSHIWWYVSRASGIVAWALASAAVLWGMALSTRALGARARAPWLLDLHRYLAGLTVLFLGFHIVSLTQDSFQPFGLDELFVPMAARWKPTEIALGVVALYLLVAVELTSLAMKRLPKRLWHGIHLLSYVVFVLASLHFLLAGTDAKNLVVRLLIVAALAGTVFFEVYRRVGPGKRASVKAGAEARSSRVAPEPLPEAAASAAASPVPPASARGARRGEAGGDGSRDPATPARRDRAEMLAAARARAGARSAPEGSGVATERPAPTRI